MYELVLVPLDGSWQAEKALNEAAKLVQRRGGIVTLLRVVPSIEELYASATPNPIDQAEQTQDSLARTAYDEQHIVAREYLARVGESIKGCGFEVVTRIREGDVPTQILAAVEDPEATVLVMTPHGKSASSTPPVDGVFGHVADEVLRRANVPVLITKH